MTSESKAGSEKKVVGELRINHPIIQGLVVIHDLPTLRLAKRYLKVLETGITEESSP